MTQQTSPFPPAAPLVCAVLLAACGNSGSPNGGALSSTAPGAILSSKTCTLGAPFPANKCWQLSYRTTDTAGKAVDTITTLIVPDSAPATGRVLVSYQTPEDGLTTDCAPSTELEKGTSGDAPQIAINLNQGWAVVVPDYEGPDSQYTAGIMAGHAVLDGIRAALSLPEAGLGPSTKVALEGYSGGALASGWAMELQREYAPELNLAGVAEGGIPANLHAVAKAADGGPLSGIEMAAAIGIKRAYTYRLDFERYLNAAGQAMDKDISRMCVGQGSNAPDAAGSYPLRKLDEFTTIPNFIDFAPLKAILDELNMGQRKPMAASVFMYHAIPDELIPIADVDALAATYCGQGVHVAYERIPAGEHVTGAVPFYAQALPYLQGVFSGTPQLNPLATVCN